MKKLSAQILVFSITGLLFASCSHFSTVSIAKRHYRSGYYVESYASNNSIRREETKAPESAMTAVNGNQPNIITSRPVSSGSESTALTEKMENIDGQITKIRSSAHPINHPAILISDFNTSNKAVESNGRTFQKNEIVALKRRYDGEGRHGLGGILWFLVVLLLILFLLNFILTLNLGGLVYIILVIALILLLFRLIGML